MAKRPRTGEKSAGQLRITTGTAGHGVSSDHAGSKPSYTHLTRADQMGRYERAEAWSRSTGRPLPPHMRIRTRPVRQATPMSDVDRVASYGGTIKFGGTVLDLTAPQTRRRRHKRNRAAG